MTGWKDRVVAGDFRLDGTVHVGDLVHEGHAARHEEHREPSHILVIGEVGDEDVGRFGLLGTGELLGEKLGDLLREIDELALAEEVAAELFREGGSFGEVPGRLSAAVRARRRCLVTKPFTARVSSASSRAENTFTADSASSTCRMAWLIFIASLSGSCVSAIWSRGRVRVRLRVARVRARGRAGTPARRSRL